MAASLGLSGFCPSTELKVQSCCLESLLKFEERLCDDNGVRLVQAQDSTATMECGVFRQRWSNVKSNQHLKQSFGCGLFACSKFNARLTHSGVHPRQKVRPTLAQIGAVGAKVLSMPAQSLRDCMPF